MFGTTQARRAATCVAFVPSLEWTDTSLSGSGATGGTIRRDASGPHATKSGSTSIVMTTDVQTACRTAGDSIRMPLRIRATIPAMRVARTADSNSTDNKGVAYRSASFALARRWPRIDSSSASKSPLLKTLASTMPLISSSTEPLQNRSMICFTARAARLRAGSIA